MKPIQRVDFIKVPKLTRYGGYVEEDGVKWHRLWIGDKLIECKAFEVEN